MGDKPKMKKISKMLIWFLVAILVLAVGIGLYVLYQGYLTVLYSV